MDNLYAKGKSFTGADIATLILTEAEYENCTFNGCDLSSSDFSDTVLTNCRFDNCNLSNIIVKQTTFNNVVFAGCKMFGIQLGNCNPFLLSFTFENCLLNYSSFYKLKAHNTRFENCGLEETDFASADMSGAVFEGCSLLAATFDNTTLEGADFRTAVGFSIDPEINRINKAKFSVYGLQGLLYKYNIEVE